MRYCQLALLLSLGIVWTASADAAPAAGTVELELVGDTHGTAMTFQDWGRALGAAGIRNVRMRTAEEPGPPGIEVQGTTDRPVYVVTGVVRSANELDLPGRRFRRNEAGQLADWLKDIAEHGPPEQREAKSAFGLPASQFARVRKDLATPVGFSTQGMRRTEVVEKIAEQLKLPLKLDAAAQQAFGDEKVEDELGDLSSGTALACALRAAGYCLTPRLADGEISYAVVEGQKGLEVWPVGWEIKKPAATVLPALFEQQNINVQNVPVSKAIEAIGKRIKTPILLDRNALERQGIEPDKTNVSMPRLRTSYSVALRRLLFQARLKHEVRCDEAGTPLVWVTTVKGG
jgi:hypothetical protein